MTARPDPTFYASAKLAMEAVPETYAYTLLLSPDFSQPDGLAVVDVDPKSSDYGKMVHTVMMPNKGDEFHHFGWNACSSALWPMSGHAFLERRFLIIPGIRSSRIYVIDTKPHPTQAKIHKIIEPEEVFHKTGYSRPHTIHCGPEGIYVSTLGGGGKDGTDGPPGIFIMDCETFDVIGRWEIDRGPQDKHYDFWWNLPRDYMVSSEWGLPPQFENGIVPEDLAIGSGDRLIDEEADHPQYDQRGHAPRDPLDPLGVFFGSHRPPSEDQPRGGGADRGGEGQDGRRHHHRGGGSAAGTS